MNKYIIIQQNSNHGTYVLTVSHIESDIELDYLSDFENLSGDKFKMIYSETLEMDTDDYEGMVIPGDSDIIEFVKENAQIAICDKILI